MDNVQLSPEMLMLVPVVAALLEVLKRIPVVAKVKEWMPFIAIGASIGVIYAQTTELQFMPAIVMGLMAAGAYSGVKAISNK
ncbi:MAG: hypothetical protein ACYS1A_20340 [Planctomycetota bacterium]|jgi:hypothetical protein